jgi:hypothetical protein
MFSHLVPGPAWLAGPLVLTRGCTMEGRSMARSGVGEVGGCADGIQLFRFSLALPSFWSNHSGS